MIIGRGQGIRLTWVKRKGIVENGLAVMMCSYLGRGFGPFTFLFRQMKFACIFVFGLESMKILDRRSGFAEHNYLRWRLLMEYEKIDDLILDIIE